MLYFVNAMQSSILYNLLPFATSAFEAHSLLTVIYIVSNSMTAAIYIPLAKMLDLWGRAEGFLLMVGFATLGMILMASSNGITTFCVAQVRNSYRFISPANNSGLLLHRIRWFDLQRRCHHSRCIQAQEQRSRIRFHLLTIHHHRIRWIQSIRRILLQCQLEMGIRCFLNHPPIRRCSSLLHLEDPSQESRESRSCCP